MTYNFIYENDYSRIIYATYIDARASIPEIKNKDGFVIKEYIDSKLSLIDDNCVTFRVETNFGVVAGFFTIQVNEKNKTATLLFQKLRPAFTEFSNVISNEIGNFIFTNGWKQNYLFDN